MFLEFQLESPREIQAQTSKFSVERAIAIIMKRKDHATMKRQSQNKPYKLQLARGSSPTLLNLLFTARERPELSAQVQKWLLTKRGLSYQVTTFLCYFCCRFLRISVSFCDWARNRFLQLGTPDFFACLEFISGILHSNENEFSLILLAQSGHHDSYESIKQ